MWLIALSTNITTYILFVHLSHIQVQYSLRSFVFDGLALLCFSYLENNTIFGKTTAGLYIVWYLFYFVHKLNFNIFSLNFCKNSTRYYHKQTYVSEFNQFCNIIFHEYQFSGSRVVPCGRTENRDECQSGFAQILRRTHSVKCRKNILGL